MLQPWETRSALRRRATRRKCSDGAAGVAGRKGNSVGGRSRDDAASNLRATRADKITVWPQREGEGRGAILHRDQNLTRSYFKTLRKTIMKQAI